MDGVFTQVFPRLSDPGCVVAAQTDQRSHPADHLLPGVVPALGIDVSPYQTVGPAIFDETAYLFADTLAELANLVEGLADRVVVQELIPLLLGVAAHGGEDRLRLGDRSGDLLAQRTDFRGEVVDDRANVVGDLFDLVFVLIGQKLPDFFEPGRRVADAG